MNYLALSSPFLLPAPSAAWLAALAAWDDALVVFPSQTHPVYRLARRAVLSGPITEAALKLKIDAKGVNADTYIMVTHHLVPIFSMPPGAIALPAERMIEHLRRRDTWAFTHGDPTSDAAWQRIEALEAEEAARVDRAWREERHQRDKGFAQAYRYRTGSRISLVSPRRPAVASSPGTPALAVTDRRRVRLPDGR